MAHIVEFSIEGLAGRRGIYKQALNSDVNVFYGENGSGKTTLLKILHASFAVQTNLLEKLPFDRADITIYLQRYETAFTRSIDRPKHTLPRETASDLVEAEPRQMEIEGLDIPKGWHEWTSFPPQPGGIRKWKHGYLPISRLYTGVNPFKGQRKNLSEEELDQIFAE